MMNKVNNKKYNIYFFIILLLLSFCIFFQGTATCCIESSQEVFQNKIVNHCYDALKIRLDQGFYDEYSKILPEPILVSKFIKDFLIVMPWEDLCNKHHNNGLLIFDEISERFLKYVQTQEQILGARLHGINYLIEYSSNKRQFSLLDLLLDYTKLIRKVVNELSWVNFVSEEEMYSKHFYTLLEGSFDKKYLALQKQLSDSVLLRFGSFFGVGLVITKICLVVYGALEPDFMSFVKALTKYNPDNPYKIPRIRAFEISLNDWGYQIMDYINKNVLPVLQNTTREFMNFFHINVYIAVLLQLIFSLIGLGFLWGTFNYMPKVAPAPEKPVLLTMHSSFENINSISSVLLDYLFTITYSILFICLLMVYFYKRYNKLRSHSRTTQIKNNSP